MGAARQVALDALTACEKQGAWSDGYLKKAIKAAELDGRDAALATRLCFGVLQNRMLLDFYLSGLCATGLEKLETPIRSLLRLGAYQILYLDRVPDHAAVSEAVTLARRSAKNPRAAGLVNGVLRNLVRQKEALPEPPDPATRYSHPQWLVDEFTRRLGGEEAEALLEADNGEPPSCAQVRVSTGASPAVRWTSVAAYRGRACSVRRERASSAVSPPRSTPAAALPGGRVPGSSPRRQRAAASTAVRARAAAAAPHSRGRPSRPRNASRIPSPPLFFGFPFDCTRDAPRFLSLFAPKGEKKILQNPGRCGILYPNIRRGCSMRKGDGP